MNRSIFLAGILLEGGNVPGANSSVPRELLDVTIQNGLELAGMRGLKYSIVGNKNKKFLGDVDLAVSAKDVAKKANLGKDSFWDDLKKFLSSKRLKNFKLASGLGQFHIVVPLVDSRGKQLSATDKNGDRGSEPGFVQLDFFVGDRDWMEDVLSSSPPDSSYKAVYRNMLLIDIFGALSFKTGDKDTRRKFQIDFKNGLKVIDFVQTGAKKKNVASKYISGNSDKIAQILFDPRVKWRDIDSFEKLWKRFTSNDFRFPEIRRDAIDRFTKSLTSKKLPLPKEVR